MPSKTGIELAVRVIHQTRPGSPASVRWSNLVGW